MNFPFFRRSIVSFAVLAAGSYSGCASAVSIVDWSLAGAPGNQISQPSSSTTPHVTGGSIARGIGLGASSALNTFSSSGWENAASGATGDEYLSFGFALDPGYAVDLDRLYLGTRSSGAGPGMLGLFYSGDGYANSLFTFNQAGTAGGTADLFSAIDLSALTGLTGSVEFRIYELGNTQADGVGETSSSGTFRLSDYFVGGTFDRNMQITGTVSAVPEAETHAMLLAGLGLVGWRIRSRDGSVRRIRV